MMVGTRNQEPQACAHIFQADWISLTISMQGRIQGGAHPARAPPKIGKNMIFLA